MSRLPEWTIPDLVDFEILLATTPERIDPGVRSRLNARLPGPVTPHDPAVRRQVFRAWLDVQREDPAGASRLPGSALATGWRTFRLLGTVAGCLLGASVTSALLHYQGSEPVNVSWFLACTLGVQFAVLFAAAIAAVLRKTTGGFDHLHPVRRLVTWAVWSGSTTLRRLPGDQRDRLRAALAILERRREIYGTLLLWPVLISTQLFAVGYNVGILSVLLLHVAATDLAFGWQSTLQVSPEIAHRLVTAAAIPWSGFAPNPHPSLAQIAGSRFAYSEGITRLDRDAMASWWPFLCYAITTYGLLLRSALLALAVWSLRSRLTSLPFQHEGCNALMRRLTGPIVQSQEGTATLAIPDQAATASPIVPHAGDGILLISSDLESTISRQSEVLARSLGWHLVNTAQVQIDFPSGNADALALVAQATPGTRAVLVAVPAWRAPIKAIALALQRIVEASGPQREVVLLLIGRPTDSGVAPVATQDLRNWRSFQAIHGLRLTLECPGSA